MDPATAVADAAAPGTPPPSVRGRIHAAVDVGSNSVHLLVASILAGRLEAVVDDRSEFLGLGAAAESWRLGPAVRDALIDALLGYAGTARSMGAEDVTFVATEPLRRAVDAAAVVRALERVGWPLHVATHEEEALLTLLGATGGRRATEEIAVVDVGGGSSDIAFAGPGHRPVAIGTKAGSARLARTAVRNDPPDPDELAAVRASAGELLSAVLDPPERVATVIAVGGTASNIVKVLALAEGGDPDPWLTRPRLERAISVMLEAPAADSAARFLLNPTRARVLPPGAAILQAILDRFGVEGLTAHDVGIREGTILATSRAGAEWRDALPVLAAGWDDEPAVTAPGTDDGEARHAGGTLPGADPAEG